MPDLKQEVYKNSSKKSTFLAIVFLVLIILLTFGVSSYNTYLENNMEIIKADIIKKEASIKTKQENKLVQVYNLYTLNKQVLERLEKYSKITTYMNELDRIRRVYNLNFKGFDYSNGELVIEATTVSNEIDLDYKKTANFIKRYRLSKTSLFDLGFVDTIETEADKQIFTLTLNVK